MKMNEIVEGGVYTSLSQESRRQVSAIVYDSEVSHDANCEYWASLETPTGRTYAYLVEAPGSTLVCFSSTQGFNDNVVRHCSLLSFARWAKHRCIHFNWHVSPYELSQLKRRKA